GVQRNPGSRRGARVFHDGQRLAFDEIIHGVNATQHQDGVASRRFDQYGKVAASGNLQFDTPDGQAKDILGLILGGQTLEIVRGGGQQLHDQLELFLAADGSFTKNGANIQKPQSTDFEQILQEGWTLAFDEVGGAAHEFD